MPLDGSDDGSDLVKKTDGLYNNSTIFADLGNEVTLEANTNSGYTWVGWYKNDVFITDELCSSYLEQFQCAWQ